MKNRVKIFILLLAGMVCMICACAAKSDTGKKLAESAVLTEKFVFDETVTKEGLSTSSEQNQEAEPESESVPYSFFWLADIQKATETEDAFKILGEWCAENKEKYNAQIILGTGDYVQNHNNDKQWEEFRKMLDAVEGKLPICLVSGNHDYNINMPERSPFLKTVYGTEDGTQEQSYLGGRGKYELLSAGGTDWLFIGMMYNKSLDTEGTEWINSILAQYPDRIAVLLLHDYMLPNGNMKLHGQDAYDKIVTPNENVRLVLCGHHYGYRIRTDMPNEESERFVQTILCNRQYATGYQSPVVVLTVDPQTEELDVQIVPVLKPQYEILSEKIKIDLKPVQ